MIRTIRFFAALFIALVPLLLMAALSGLGIHVGRTNAGWSVICTILLLGVIAYKVLTDKGWLSQ